MVDCGGDPSAAEDITGLSVHQYETAERVIDLDDLQWAGGNETTLDEPRVLVRGCLPLSTSYPVFPLASVDRPFQALRGEDRGPRSPSRCHPRAAYAPRPAS